MNKILTWNEHESHPTNYIRLKLQSLVLGLNLFVSSQQVSTPRYLIQAQPKSHTKQTNPLVSLLKAITFHTYELIPHPSSSEQLQPNSHPNLQLNCGSKF
jgi:hypothetical protein